MDWTQAQYARIAHLLPKQRGNVEVENLTFLRALQYIAANGCKWRALPEHFGKLPKAMCAKKSLLMDKAYEGDGFRKKVKKCGMRPVVPPKSNRKKPWRYDKKLYRGRNMVERNFRLIKEFRRVHARYDKLDETYNAFIEFANIVIHLKN